MKINYKKIASVLASTVMLGSTVAFASAAWPAPLVNNGVEDAAIVIGASAAESDNLAAVDLGASLDKSITATTGGSIAGEGDKVKIAKGSSKVNLNDSLSAVWGTSVTKSELPTVLGDGVFNNKQNSEYKYEQTFAIGHLNFTHFSDSNYENRLPTLGFSLGANKWVGNYTLNFITYPESAQSTTDNSLTDLESKTIKILGKDYYILDFKNTTDTNGKIILLDAATTASLNEDEKKTLTVSDKTYEVSVSFITSDEVILNVNGVDTEKLSATGTSYGNTYKLADGSYVGVKTINVQNYAGGTKSVDFSIGKGKLEINGVGGSVKINDKTVNDLYGYFTFGTSNSKVNWQKMVIRWQLSDKNFLTPGKQLVMPGFEAIKYVMEDIVVPSKETTKMQVSSDYLALKTTIKDGETTIPLLWVNASSLMEIGQSNTQRLATTNNTMLPYNASGASGSGRGYSGFVVSYAGSRDAESYYLDVASVTQDTDAGRNVTTIRNKLTNDEWSDRKAGDTITLGSVVLTIDSVTYGGGGSEKVVNISLTSCSGCSFNTLYTKDGLKIWLPWESYIDALFQNASGASKGELGNATGYVGNTNSLWTLWMQEEDKDGTIANGGIFNLTITNATSGTTYRISVTGVSGTDAISTLGASSGAGYETPTSGSKVWESYVYSKLASKVIQDRTDTNQYSASVEYYGGEVYANVYVAAPSVTTSGGAATIKVVKDSEVDSVKSKNLVVIGGSCINTVAATLLGSTTPLCGADFTAKTNAAAGQYLIKTFASPYDTAKIAMLVAGYDAAETTAAVNKVKEGTTSTTVDTEVVGPTAA